MSDQRSADEIIEAGKKKYSYQTTEEEIINAGKEKYNYRSTADQIVSSFLSAPLANPHPVQTTTLTTNNSQEQTGLQVKPDSIAGSFASLSEGAKKLATNAVNAIPKVTAAGYTLAKETAQNPDSAAKNGNSGSLLPADLLNPEPNVRGYDSFVTGYDNGPFLFMQDPATGDVVTFGGENAKEDAQQLASKGVYTRRVVLVKDQETGEFSYIPYEDVKRQEDYYDIVNDPIRNATLNARKNLGLSEMPATSSSAKQLHDDVTAPISNYSSTESWDSYFYTSPDAAADRQAWLAESEERLKTMPEGQEKNELETEVNQYKRGEGKWATYDKDGYQTGFTNATIDSYLVLLNDQDFRDLAETTAAVTHIPDADEAEYYDAIVYGGYTEVFPEYGDPYAVSNADGAVMVWDKEKENYVHPALKDGRFQDFDRLGIYLSITPEEESSLNTSTTNVRAQALAEAMVYHWDLLTPDEIAVYYGLRAKSVAEAEQFLQDMQPTLDHRFQNALTANTVKEYREGSGLDKFGMSLSTVPKKLISAPFAYVSMALNWAAGEEPSFYGRAFEGMHYSNAVRNERATDYNALAPNVNIFGLSAGDLYQAGMSGADSLAVSFVPGGYALLGADAAVNEGYDLYKSGADSNQIFVGATATGIIEMVAERLPFEELNLLKKKDINTWVDFGLNVLKQAGVEYGEEFTTELANGLADFFNRTSESDWTKLWEENDGDFGKVAIQVLSQANKAGISGALSGAGNAAVVGMPNAIIGTTNSKTQGTTMPQADAPSADVGGNTYTPVADVSGANAPVSEVQTSPVSPAQKVVDTVVSSAAQSGNVTNSQAASILQTPGAVEYLQQKAELKLPGTASGNRAAVKSAVMSVVENATVSGEMTTPTVEASPAESDAGVTPSPDVQTIPETGAEAAARQMAEYFTMPQNDLSTTSAPTGTVLEQFAQPAPMTNAERGVIELARLTNTPYPGLNPDAATNAPQSSLPAQTTADTPASPPATQGWRPAADTPLQSTRPADASARGTTAPSAVQTTPPVQSTVAAAISSLRQNGYVSDSIASQILNDPEAIAYLQENAGLQLPGDPEGNIAAVKKAIMALQAYGPRGSAKVDTAPQTNMTPADQAARQLADLLEVTDYPRPESKVDTEAQTVYDIKNEQGGAVYGTAAKRQAGLIPERANPGNSTDGSKASTEAARRSGIQEAVHQEYGNLEQTFNPDREAAGLRKIKRHFTKEQCIEPAKNSPLGNVQKRFADEYNVECYVVKDSEWDFEDPAICDDGAIFIKESIDSSYWGLLIPHESTHVMKQKGFVPYLEFIEQTAEYVNLASPGVAALYEKIAKHCKVTLTSMSDTDVLRFFDELNATIYATYMEGVLPENIGEFNLLVRESFYDFDTYIAELDSIHQQYKQHVKSKDSTRDGQAHPSVGAVDAENYGKNTVGSAESRFEHEVKTSKQYSNTFENAVDEDVRAVGTVSKQLDPTIDQYDVITEKESLHNADLRTRSSEERAAEYDYLMSKEGWSAEDADTAMKLCKYLLHDGDLEAAGKLARRRREVITNWAQGVQSQAKYTRTADQAYTNGAEAIKSLAPNNVPRRFYKKQGFDAWRNQLSKSYVEMVEQVENIKDGDTAAMKNVIRSLAQFRHTTAWMGYKSRLTKAAEAGLANLDFDTAKTVALTQISQIPGDFVKRPVGRVIKTIRFQSMLASVKSVVRNLGGNGAMITDAISDSTVGQFFDFLVSKVTGQRTVGNDLAHPKEYLDAAKKACSFGSLCVELAIPTESDGKYSATESRTFSPAVPGNSLSGLLIRYLSAVEKYYSYAYGITDTFFEAGTSSAVDASLQKLGESSGLTEQQQQNVSKMVGERRTFKADGKLAESTRKVKEAFDFGLEYGLGTHFLPFSRVNANMTQVAIDYTSLGTKGTFEILKYICDVKKNSEKIDPVRQRKAVTDAARGVTGTGLVALFTVFALSGVLRASDEDDWDRAAMEESTGQVGAQFNASAALRVLSGKEAGEWKETDVCISLDFLEPFNTQMLLATLLAEDINAGEGVKNYPANSLSAIVQSVLNNPSMELITDIYNLTRKVGSAETAADGWYIAGEMIGDTAASLIPSYVRQLAQTVDNVKRDTSSNNLIQTAVNKLLANIPGASMTLPAKYGADGNPIQRSANPALGITNNFINPATITVLGDQEMSNYLGELSDRTGKTSFYPEASAPKKFTVNGEEVLVEGKEMRETYQSTYMGYINSLYTNLLSDPVFNALPDNLKVEALETAKQYATEQAKASVSDYSLSTWVSEAGEDPATAILSKVAIGVTEDALENLRKDWSAGNATTADALADAWGIVSAADVETREALIAQATGTAQDFLKAMDAGTSPEVFHDLYKNYREIENTDGLSASSQAVNWGYVLDTAVEQGRITQKQRDLLFKSLGFTAHIPQEAQRYNELIDSGLSADESTGLLGKIAAITPAPGRSQASDHQKFETIVDYPGLTDAEQDAVLRLYMDDRQEAKYDKALKMGISTEDYVDAYATANGESGEGKKKRVIAQFQKDYGLSYETAKALYEIFFPPAK